MRETAAAVAAVLATDTGTDWHHHFPRPGRVVDLPAYPWQHERYWHGAPQDLVVRATGDGTLDHPLAGERMPAPHPVWHGTVEPQLVPWLGDHRIGEDVLMPAAAYVEMALSAGRRALDRPVEVRHLEIGRPLSVPWPDPTPLALQTAVTPEDGALTVSVREEHHGSAGPSCAPRSAPCSARHPRRSTSTRSGHAANGAWTGRSSTRGATASG